METRWIQMNSFEIMQSVSKFQSFIGSFSGLEGLINPWLAEKGQGPIGLLHLLA